MSLILCSFYVLKEERQIVNFYETVGRMNVIKSKAYESKVNIITEFLHRLDLKMISKEIFHYSDINNILKDMDFEQVYSKDHISTHIFASCRTLNRGERLENNKPREFPFYNGTQFLLTLEYHISSDVGEEFHATDTFLVSYTVDFQKVLETLDKTRTSFDKAVEENNFKNMTEEQIEDSILDLSLQYVGECAVNVLNILIDEDHIVIYYRTLYSTFYQSALDLTERKLLVYDDSILTVNLR